VFDLNPGGDALTDYFPRLARPIDLGDIKGQMAMFDRLIAADGRAKVVDVSHASFARFFAISQAQGHACALRQQGSAHQSTAERANV
jgi:hypothetical protein